jgi:MFS family permease
MSESDSSSKADSATSVSGAAGGTGAPISDAYANYVLAVLFVVMMLNLVDRSILAIVLEPIKQEFGASDTALGLLSGFAFAIFYSAAGIPVARWADRGVRRSIIALGLVAWSGMTALSGLAQNFTQLVLTRVGVGIGEAAGSPPTHSLLSDYFPAERRATILAIVSIGSAVGAISGAFVGGWVNEFYGWRMAFFVVGLPGIALALVVRLTVREPPRGRFDPPRAQQARDSVWTVLGFMLSLASYRHLILATSLHAFAGAGLHSWTPAFLIRVHEMDTGAIGTALLLGQGLPAMLGIYLGGRFSDRLAKRDMRWYMWLPAGATLCALPFSVLFLLLPETPFALVCLAPAAFFGGMYAGPQHAMAMGLAKPHMRAMSSAILTFSMSLIGYGLGPLAVGMLSDVLTPEFGSAGLRYALLLVVLGHLLAALHNMLSSRTLRDDLGRAATE